MFGGRNEFRKSVPTDLDFSPTFYGGYVDVCCTQVDSFLGDECVVSIYGGDSVMLSRRGLTLAQALKIYNKLQLIQSEADLVDFSQHATVGTENNNGWPHSREDRQEEQEEQDGRPQTLHWGGPRRGESCG